MMTPAEQKFILGLLGMKQPFESNPERLSVVAMLLRNARDMTGRNLDTGEYERKELCNEYVSSHFLFEPRKFNGLFNYLILLEQLGTILEVSCSSTSDGMKEIDFVLCKYASFLSEGERRAIRFLRHAFAHQFSLAIVQKKRKKGEKKIDQNCAHKFTISIEESKNPVNLRKRDWTGDFTDKKDDSSTIIYVRAFGDMVEKIYSDFLRDVVDNKVSLAIGIDEIKTRFTVIH